MSSNVEYINYPISLDYRKHWSEWHSIREIIQNAMDATQEANTSYSDGKLYKITRENGNLSIEDLGRGLVITDLILGETSKTGNSQARGMYGEGMKLSFVVLKRLGYNVKVETSYLEINTKTYHLADRECLQLECIHNTKKRVGSKVTIIGYSGPSFEERFLSHADPRIKFTNDRGMILETTKGETSQVFVKDIYINLLVNAAFSYNLNNARLEESRSIVDEYSLQLEIGNLWCKCEDKALWVKFFESVDSGKYEAKAKFASYMYLNNKDIVKEAFNEAFPNAVLSTSEDWSREATWRGKTPITCFNETDHRLFFDTFETDKSFVLKDSGKEDLEIADKDLSPLELENLEKAREIAKRVNKYQEIRAYVLDSNTLGKSGNPIKLTKSLLSSLEATISATIHELTHTYYNCEDLTVSMFHNLSDMGAKLLTPYIKTEFSTSLLAQKVGTYTQYRVSVPKEIAHNSDPSGSWLSKGDKVIVTISKAQEVV